MVGGPVESVDANQMQVVAGVGSWMVCSVGMLVFNKRAIGAFPVECTLVAVQMLVAVATMLLCCWSSLHIGSLRDVMRWSRVVPFYTGMLLTSILALKYAPMSLVVVFRVLSPLFGMAIERLYPNPLTITPGILASITVMFAGAFLYCTGLDKGSFEGIGWVVLNNCFAIGDRLLQRLMLAKDQHPVDISKTGVTLLNNLLGMVPLVAVAAMTGEFAKVGGAVAHLDAMGYAWVVISCVVGVGISYTGIWAQSMITATSFLVLVNANKFIIILMEVTIMHTKSLTHVQFVGSLFTIFGGLLYGYVRQLNEEEAKKGLEKKPMLEEKAV